MYNPLDINQNIILTLDLASEKYHQSPTHTFVDADIYPWRYWETLYVLVVGGIGRF